VVEEGAQRQTTHPPDLLHRLNLPPEYDEQVHVALLRSGPARDGAEEVNACQPLAV
jgi:hypothetical protein